MKSLEFLGHFKSLPGNVHVLFAYFVKKKQTEDHESRLRVIEMREEEQRKQVQEIVRQYTGEVASAHVSSPVLVFS